MTSDVWQNRIVGEGEVAAGELVAHPQNWRKHPKEQAAQLAAGLGGVGWVQRVIVNRRTGRMLDGHLRAELARRQGEATPVPVVYVDLSEDEERTVLATLDPIAGMAIADEATLAGLVRSIEDADLRSIAGSVAQVLNVDVDGKADAGADTEPQIDRAEELREKWGVQPGDLWQLGEHRLICGDCTDAAVVARVMGGEMANGCFTSPPYAMQRAAIYGGVPVDQYVDWWEAVQANVRSSLEEDGSFFINIKAHTEDKQRSLYVVDLVVAMVRRWGWKFAEEFCWLRVGIPGSAEMMGRFKNQFEPIYQFSVGEYKFRPRNVMHETDAAVLDTNYQPGFSQNSQGRDTPFDRRKVGPGMAFPGNVIRAQQKEAFGHSATFPVDLPGFFIRAFSDDRDSWLEPFSGSGSTLIACENLGRRCRAVEIAPGYVAVALERFHVHTGKTPVRVEAG